MAGTNPTEVLAEVDPDSLPAESPPEAANYRAADVQGIACAFCTKFRYGTSDSDTLIPEGTCGLWEAKVKGDYVCDRYTDSGPILDEDGKPEERDVLLAQQPIIDYEFYLPGEGAEFATETDTDGLLWKEIFREGEWQYTPTANGIIKKPLKVVDEGESDLAAGIISLSDLEENFNKGVIKKVGVPLAPEDGKDHKSVTKTNTGYIKKVKRKKVDGKSRLFGAFEFTEPEVAEKCRRNTYGDVSSGIFPHLDPESGTMYPAVLKHVCITNTPFIEGMGPFGVTASAAEVPDTVVGLVPVEQDTSKYEEKLSFTWRKGALEKALTDQLNLSGYTVDDIAGTRARISHPVAEISWIASFELTEDGVRLDPASEWEMQNEGEQEQPSEEEEVEKPNDNPSEDETTETPEESPEETEVEELAVAASLSPLEAARKMRQLRLTQTNDSNSGGAQVAIADERLAGVELSGDTESAVNAILEENKRLKAESRKATVEARITELEGMGFSNAPGALKLYRRVALAEDGGPAAVLFSGDDGLSGEQAPISALEILDQFIEGLPKEGDELVFSQQAVTTGNDDPPPVETTGDERPVDERTKDMFAAIGETPAAA